MKYRQQGKVYRRNMAGEIRVAVLQAILAQGRLSWYDFFGPMDVFDYPADKF
jgi:hypothetical protein